MAALDDLKGADAHTMINEDQIPINKKQKPLRGCGVEGEVRSQPLECPTGSQSASMRKVSWVKYNSHHIKARVSFAFIPLFFNALLKCLIPSTAAPVMSLF